MKNIYYLIFLLLSVSVFFNRLNNQKNDMQWLDDSARDLMIAEKISDQREFFFVQPNSGALYFIKNSFFYYNFLGFIFYFSGGTDVFLIVHTLILSLSVFAGFGIGYLLGGPWLGLICLAILSFDTDLIFMQQSIYQRNYPASTSLILIFLSLFFFRKPSKIRITLLYLFYLFSILIYSSMFTFVPALFIISFQFIFSIEANKRMGNVIYIVLLAIFSALTWMVLSGNNLFAIFSGFIYLENENYQIFQIKDILLNTSAFFNRILPSFLMQYMMIPFFVLLLVFFILFITKKLNKRLNVYFLYLYSILLHYLFSTLLSSELLTKEYYLNNYYVLFLIFIPIALFSLHSLVKSSLLKTFFIILTFLYVVSTLVFRKEEVSYQEYYNYNSLSDLIYEDIQKNGGVGSNDFLITDYSDWARIGWFSPALLFFLDDDLKNSLTVLSNDGNNLEYKYPKHINKIYLLCHHFPEKMRHLFLSAKSKESAWKYCISQFEESSKENKAIDSFFKKDYVVEEFYSAKDFHKNDWGLFKLSVIQ